MSANNIITKQLKIILSPIKPQIKSSTKRSRVVSPEPPTEEQVVKGTREKQPTSKKSKTAKMTSKDMDELKQLISNSTIAIEKKIDDSTNALEAKVSNLATTVNEDVNSLRVSVEEFNSKISDDISGIKLQLNEHTQRLDNTDDDIQRMRLSQDLRLTGFAHKENENLLDLFFQMATIIEFAIDERSGAPTLERRQFKNRTTGQFMPSATILIHFAISRQKEMFYSRYLKKMPLDPVKFGLPSEQRIMVSENLTAKNAKIFKQALSLKKEKKIAQTFTEDGIVYIRFKSGKSSPTHVIRNVTALETLVTQNEQANATADGAESNSSNNNNVGNGTTNSSGSNNSNVINGTPMETS